MGAPPTSNASWICPTAAERERFRDLHARLLPVNARIMAVLGLIAVPLGLTLPHPLAVVPMLLAIAVFTLVQWRADSFARPEVWVFAALLGAEAAIAAAATVSGLNPDPGLALLCWPAAGVAGRFRRLPVAVGTGWAVLLIAGSTLASGVSSIADAPLQLILLIASVLCVVSLVMALRDSDVEHRGAAVVDGLTGLLNRTALRRRVAEMEAQSNDRDAPVAVAIIDIDFFKLVNDRHGHAAGDQILRELGALLRTELRAYDQAYRLGGEEFALLLPGAGLPEAVARAERLRYAIAAHDTAVPVTVSIGVAATRAGDAFTWDEQFEHADRELYAAKRAGRNRVHPVLATTGHRREAAGAVAVEPG